MAKVSPSCVKNADKRESSSWDLSLAISQARIDIKLTKAHGFIVTPLVKYMKKNRKKL